MPIALKSITTSYMYCQLLLSSSTLLAWLLIDIQLSHDQQTPILVNSTKYTHHRHVAHVRRQKVPYLLLQYITRTRLVENRLLYSWLLLSALLRTSIFIPVFYVRVSFTMQSEMQWIIIYRILLFAFLTSYCAAQGEFTTSQIYNRYVISLVLQIFVR